MKDAVRRRIEELGDEGGHILAAVHNIQSDVAPEDICEMFDAALEYGG
jgi:uroporphyrinogen decarboxylase